MAASSAAAPSKKFKVGLVGLGKLGMPVAVGIDYKGHDVMGYDISPSQMQKESFPHREIGPNGEPSLEPFVKASGVKFAKDLDELVAHASDIIFIAVQTPHEALYEGITRIPESRKDFNYEWLRTAVANVSKAIERLGEERVVIIISTVLPGTLNREIFPVLNKYVKLCYNPFFIAMGTVLRDFYEPEFILFGVVDDDAAKIAEEFYKTVCEAPFCRMSLESAELTKVSYNTYIGMKIVFANTLMELCNSLPNTDVDEVTGALKLAKRRLLSPMYLNAGMGDGGGCHPRDNIAMSWLARKTSLSYNWFDAVMMAREEQTVFLAKLLCGYDQPKVILGKSFKPETNMTVGSPAILLKNLCEELGAKVNMYDPWTDGEDVPEYCKVPSVFFIGTKHDRFTEFKFPKGSVVLDPHRYIPKQDGVEVVGIGIGEKKERVRGAAAASSSS